MHNDHLGNACKLAIGEHFIKMLPAQNDHLLFNTEKKLSSSKNESTYTETLEAPRANR